MARYLLGATFLAYLVGTALLYFFGPWQYPMPAGRGRLIAFIIAAHAALALGYVLGVRGTPRAAGLKLPVETLVLASVAIQLVLLLPTSHFATGHWIPNPWRAATSLGAVYTESLHRRSTEMPYVNYIRILLSPILVVGVPLAVFYWGRLHRFTKWLCAVSVIGTLTLYVAIGTNSAGGEWMGLFPWFVVASHIAGVHRLDRKGWMKAAAVQGLSIVFFGALFSASMVQRRGSFVKLGLIPGIGATLEREPEADAELRLALRDRDLRHRAQAAARKDAEAAMAATIAALPPKTREALMKLIHERTGRPHRHTCRGAVPRTVCGFGGHQAGASRADRREESSASRDYRPCGKESRRTADVAVGIQSGASRLGRLFFARILRGIPQLGGAI